ncbi:MAG: Gfo/Idh/MocA family oxidoreductase [Chloroflexi bacterium]|nr:Gfo/Idh/MocA family oxidoreductase [Chloroflexota bacterium]MCL5273946.1 Gfo/Idh/MocA family oxidoreductase [Chloroflexota bacterium]
MSTQSARIAFIGAGNHSTESLYPNIAHIPEFDLVAVCDIVPKKAQYAARRYGAPEWFTDVETMLEQVKPEGVCVCGPAEMHYAVGLQALRRGIPLFVEKPPAVSLSQVEEMVNAANQHDTWGMVGFMKRFAPANVVAKEYMSQADFGRLSTITLIHGSGPYNDIKRMLLFNGIHMIDLGRYLGGDIASVFAYGLHEQPGVQAVSASLRFANGAVGQLNMNSGHSWSDCYEMTYVSGTGAGIVIDASRSTEVMSAAGRFAQGEGLQLYGWSNRYYVSGNMAGWASGGHYTRGYWGELNHFARAVMGQVQPGPTLEDAAQAIELIEAIERSIATGTEVQLG